MYRVSVIVMGGARFTYEPGSSFHFADGWLIVDGTSRTPVAAYAAERVVRVYYVNPDGTEKGLAGVDKT